MLHRRNMKTKKMTFNIDDADHKILKKAAVDANLTMALFIMKAVRELIERNKLAD